MDYQILCQKSLYTIELALGSFLILKMMEEKRLILNEGTLIDATLNSFK